MASEQDDAVDVGSSSKTVRVSTRAKYSDDEVKATMHFREATSCATCKHCTEHPDSGRGGQSWTLFQCGANAIHPFKLPPEATRNVVCDFHKPVVKPTAKG